LEQELLLVLGLLLLEQLLELLKLELLLIQEKHLKLGLQLGQKQGQQLLMVQLLKEHHEHKYLND